MSWEDLFSSSKDWGGWELRFDIIWAELRLLIEAGEVPGSLEIFSFVASITEESSHAKKILVIERNVSKEMGSFLCIE